MLLWRRASGLWGTALFLGSIAGCGGGGGSTAPDPLRPVANALTFTITPAVHAGTTVDFTWRGSGASGFRLEIGSSPGASDVLTVQTPAAPTAYTWAGVPVGNFHARVVPLQGATVGRASEEVLVGSVDARHMIDAMLFAYGPLAVVGNTGRGLLTGYWQDRVLGWQPGSGISVVLGGELPDAWVSSIEKTLQQLGPATEGLVHAGVAERRPDVVRTPGPGEVSISRTTPDEVRDECRCDSCVGCASTWYYGAFIQRSRILLSSEAAAATPAHEIGHAIGLAHVISAAGVRPSFTMGVTTDGEYSPRGRLDVLDLGTVKMLQTVYGAGLTAGSRRTLFEAAGLVFPEGAMAARGRSPRLPPGYRVTEDGQETVVTRSVCQIGP